MKRNTYYFNKFANSSHPYWDAFWDALTTPSEWGKNYSDFYNRPWSEIKRDIDYTANSLGRMGKNVVHNHLNYPIIRDISDIGIDLATTGLADFAKAGGAFSNAGYDIARGDYGNAGKRIGEGGLRILANAAMYGSGMKSLSVGSKAIGGVRAANTAKNAHRASRVARTANNMHRASRVANTTAPSLGRRLAVGGGKMALGAGGAYAADEFAFKPLVGNMFDANDISLFRTTQFPLYNVLSLMQKYKKDSDPMENYFMPSDAPSALDRIANIYAQEKYPTLSKSENPDDPNFYLYDGKNPDFSFWDATKSFYGQDAEPHYNRINVLPPSNDGSTRILQNGYIFQENPSTGNYENKGRLNPLSPK